MIGELRRIGELVGKHAGQKAQNLASNINRETLYAIHKEMDGKKAPGIDEVRKEDYSAGVDDKLENLVSRMKREATSHKRPGVHISTSQKATRNVRWAYPATRIS